MSNKRFMIAASASGSGKTLISCGLMALLTGSGYRVQSFKCGPDYIDPMFHAHITGRPGGNLDAFMASSETIRQLLFQGMEAADFTIIEGVMGCFDGIGFGTSDGSSCAVAAMTGTPVILVMNARGMSTTILPILRGLMQEPDGAMIRGVILNRISKGVFPAMKKMIEAALPLSVIGYLPDLPDIHLDSRHLGLMMPHEINDLDRHLDVLSSCLSETIDLEALTALAGTAPGADTYETARTETNRPAADLHEAAAAETHQSAAAETRKPAAEEAPAVPFPHVRIGVARDEAFCFFYTENLRMLEARGAELVFFSPVHDRTLPEDLDLMLLYGGYPELCAKELSQNESMRSAICCAWDSGMPLFAECGGFLYLHRTLEDADGTAWPMCGILPEDAYNNHKLTRFGYITLQDPSVFGQKTGAVRAHEFHHYDSTNPGSATLAVKPDGKRSWSCFHSTETLHAGFPHLYYPNNPAVADAIVCAAAAYRKRKTS